MSKGPDFEQPDSRHFSIPEDIITIQDLKRHFGPPELDEPVAGETVMPTIIPEFDELDEQAKQEMWLCLNHFIERRARRRGEKWNPED